MASDDPKQLGRLIMKLKEQVERDVNDRLPRKVGIIAVQHFKQNFRDSGFTDGGLRPWKKSQRELRGGMGASARYKTLTSARNHLMSSTQAHIGRGEVSIENPVPYAVIHNEGGTIVSNPTITPKMRKYAWAMVYKLSRRKKGRKGKRTGGSQEAIPEEAKRWMALALTKKTKLKIRAKMPKRQFIGESRELMQKVSKEVNDSIQRIKDGISTL
jgi:phage virion morphogenesis family|nr:MAG TPA: tail morphogenesis protein [Caudoviricetes sp.]